MHLSPLRYPGGKGLLLRFVREIVARNAPAESTYVEPFAGGAAIALGLLRSGDIGHAIIGDADPAIAAFWETTLNHPEELIDRIRRCSVTIETWHEQFEILQHADGADMIDLGFAAFFLNRTNRSGILRARPIGGLKQDGPYKIDCRFNKANLIQRLEQVALLSDRMTVFSGDAVQLLTGTEVRRAGHVFVYGDPPYLTKSSDLYMDTMTYDKHQQFADTLASRFRHWIVSYDCDPRVARDLYPDCDVLQFSLRHSARRAHRGSELMTFSPHINPDSAAHLLSDAKWQRRSNTRPLLVGSDSTA